jgi:WD40 repeat protein
MKKLTNHFFSQFPQTLRGCMTKRLNIGNSKFFESQIILKDDNLNYIHCIAVSGDLIHFASGGSDSNIKIWDYSSLTVQKILKGHNSDVLSICFSKNSEILFSISLDRILIRWDLKNGTRKMICRNISIINALYIYEEYLISVSSTEIVLWDTNDDSIFKQISILNDFTLPVSFLLNNRLFTSKVNENEFNIWEIPSGKELFHGTINSCIQTISGFKDDSFLIGDDQGNVHIIDKEYQCIGVLNVSDVAVSKIFFGGRILVTVSYDYHFRIWSPDTLDSIELSLLSSKIRCISQFSNKSLLIGTDKSIMILEFPIVKNIFKSVIDEDFIDTIINFEN